MVSKRKKRKKEIKLIKYIDVEEFKTGLKEISDLASGHQGDVEHDSIDDAFQDIEQTVEKLLEKLN